MLLSLAGLMSFGAPKARANEDKDPPTRVARISFVDGSVSLQPGGQGDWGSAARNRPMTIGDKIWVDKDSRAELQAGPAAMHLGSMTALSFLNLDQGITQMRLAEGSINFRVRELRQGDVYEVDAPNVAFIVKEAGAFRIDVDENGDSARVTVLRGEGEVTAGGKTYEVHAGERAEFTGTDNVQYSVDRAPGPDGLDRWASERDSKEDRSVSSRYVSRDMVGYDDLDDYGTWRDEPEYGHVWYPSEVAPGWAPYSYGYWNWVGPWGWTWVDYSPWGFAPYHYGRWNYFGGGWGWCPGPYVGYPVYGPAFVGFLGGGFGFGFEAGFGFGGGIGWFPLGFGEPFFPWFGCSHNFITVINVHNTVINNTNVFNSNIHNVNFVNAHNVNAVTVANRNTFMNGQAINRGATHLTAASLNGARVTNSVGIRPTQHSALGAVNIKSNVAKPSAAVQNRTVIARTAPAQGASQMHVRTVSSAGLTSGRTGNGPVNSNQRAASQNMPSHIAPSMNNRPGNAPATNNRPGNTPATNNRPGGAPTMNSRPSNMPSTSGMTSRQQQLSQNRPPSAMTNSNRTSAGATVNNSTQRPGNSTRTWEAQGNTSDRGRPPAGFGSSSASGNSPVQSARGNQANRPPLAGGGSQSGAPSGQSSRPSAPNYNSNRPSSSGGGRSYEPPQRTYNNAPNNGNRGSSQPPSRSYSTQPSYSAPRTYSAPSRSYPAPSRSYSAPSYSGGGGGSRGSGGPILRQAMAVEAEAIAAAAVEATAVVVEAIAEAVAAVVMAVVALAEAVAAVAMAAVALAAAVVVAAVALMVEAAVAPTAGALPLTVTLKLITNETARPDIPDGPFFSQSTLHLNYSGLLRPNISSFPCSSHHRPTIQLFECLGVS